MKTIMIILISIPTMIFAQECPVTTTWSEQDALYFGINPNDASGFTINNEYNANITSSYTRFFVVIDSTWEGEGDRNIQSGDDPSKWRYGIDIHSYNDPSYAAKWYTKAKNAGYPTTICQEISVSYMIGSVYYSCTISGNVFLAATYRDRFTIYVTLSNNHDPRALSELTPTLLTKFDQAKALIDSKCDTANHKPFIALLPLPSEGYSFQLSLLQGKGFQILVQDQDGIGDIDWTSFKVFVAGNDTTQYFYNILINQDIRSWADTTSNAYLVHIIPDPSKLMGTHDLFAIPFNGDWVIELEICDQGKSCFRSTNVVYFGPFATLSDACLRNIATGWYQLVVNNLCIGNTGFDSGENDTYAVLHNIDTPSVYLSFYSSEYWWNYGVKPAMKSQSFPTGHLSTDPQLAFPGYVPESSYELFTAIVDNASGAIGIDRQDTPLCEP